MQLMMFEPQPESLKPSSSGKMSTASCLQRTTPSDAFWESLPAKAANWNHQGEGGRTLVLCMDPREQSRGGFSMPNISEWPNDAAVCSLSQVLETGSIPPQYFLSSTACAGILRRAEARRKVLPAALQEALEAVTKTASNTP